MALRLYRAAEVCEITELQPYVLRSWEKEFPGIGLQKSPGSARLYRQADIDQVLRIKQLVFGEGLTVAGARRHLEESELAMMSEGEVAALAPDPSLLTQSRLAAVRQGLLALRTMLEASAEGGEAAQLEEGRPRRVAAESTPARKAGESKRRRVSA